MSIWAWVSPDAHPDFLARSVLAPRPLSIQSCPTDDKYEEVFPCVPNSGGTYGTPEGDIYLIEANLGFFELNPEICKTSVAFGMKDFRRGQQINPDIKETNC